MPRKTVRFTRGPSAATPTQTRARTRVATTPGETQAKTVVAPSKPIIKTEPDPTAVVREVQSDKEDSYTQQEFDELANLPMDSEAEDLGEVDPEEPNECEDEQ